MAYSERQMKQTTVTTKSSSASVFCEAVATERNEYDWRSVHNGTAGKDSSSLASKSQTAREERANHSDEDERTAEVPWADSAKAANRRSEVKDVVEFIEQSLACLEGELQVSDSIGRRLLQSQLNAALESARTLAAHERDLRLAFEANSMEMTSNLRSASIKH